MLHEDIHKIKGLYLIISSSSPSIKSQSGFVSKSAPRHEDARGGGRLKGVEVKLHQFLTPVINGY